MFAGTELAARLERAECGLLAHAAEATRVRAGVDVVCRELAGGLAVHAGADSPLTKVAGVGFAGPLDAEALAEVEGAFAARKTPVQVELSCLADGSVGEQLTGRGYRLQGFENVLGMALAPGRLEARPPAGITVAASDSDGFAAWLNAVVGGFIHPDDQGLASHEEFSREALERVIGDMAAAEGFRRYLARREGTVAGGASMHLVDGVAALCGAATLPAHRRRGVQTALLAHRLDAAAAAGCDIATTTTLPGSRSQQNVQRQGFAVLYTRAVLVRTFAG